MNYSALDLQKISLQENITVKDLNKFLKNGESIIITSSRKGIEPVGIGKKMRAKFACIVGTSTDETDIDFAVKKAKVAVKYGASVIHNGSTGGNIAKIQKRLIDEINVPLAVCHPIGVMADACYKKRRFSGLKEMEFIEQVKKDIEQGIEVILLPLGVNRSIVKNLKNSSRIMPCCGKSGSIMASWIAHNNKENPYCVHFDEILEMAKEHNTTLSIVAAFRSGCIHDALDDIQNEELKFIKEYVDRAKEAGVKIKAGSGGHLPADKIEKFFRYQKSLLKVPVISFGPQVSDISLGYDHVSAAMGQMIAFLSGADMIFSMTPAEHLSMPDEEQTKQGCITAKIVCHSADIARGKDLDLDETLSKAREKMDWAEQAKFTQDISVLKKLRSAAMNKKKCSICGSFCAYKTMRLNTK